MKIFVIGSGAREHAFAWKLSREHGAGSIICAPGNPGIAEIAHCFPADPANPDTLLAIAKREQVDLTVVGPEVPLSRGVVDVFTAERQTIVGPYRSSGRARIEQGVCERLHGAPERSHRALSDL
jgi:phosphoribosylamine--glycine ligase